MNGYDFRFFARFTIGGLGGFAGTIVCMRYGFAAGGLLGGTAYWLSWVVCKALGLFPPPLKPGWGG